jgi:zinc protease
MSRIREKEGLSYGVGSGFRSSPLDPRSTFSFYAISNPKNAEKVVKLTSEVIEILRKDGVTEEELAEAKEGWVKGQESDRGDDQKLAALLSTSLFAGRTLKFQAELEAKIGALKQEDVAAAMRKYVDPSKLVNAIVGDFK